MAEPASEPWAAPAATGRLLASCRLPGSKSLTNRALVLAALSATPTRIRNPLRARDTELMAAALRNLGTTIEELDDDSDGWLVTPGPMTGGPVECGLAGTVMRFVPPLAALAAGDSSFDGDPHARTRPMLPLLAALRQAGAQISDDDRGALPFTVHGTGGLPGGPIALDSSQSSQFMSAMLIAASRFEQGAELHNIGPRLPSLPHIEMTVRALTGAGARITSTGPERWQVEPATLDLADQLIEPDLSNASPFLAAALVTGGTVTVPGWPAETSQPGALLGELLTRMGATVTLDASGLTVTGTGAIGPLVADLHEASELTPVLAALAALADGESRITGVGHIRGHETDRLAALRVELSALGAEVNELPDGLVIEPAPLRPGLWRCYADHRMAQAGAVLGLAIAGLTVDDIDCTSKTMPDFTERWAALLEQSG